MEYVSLQMLEYIACTQLLILETNSVILWDICTLFHILGGGYSIFPSNVHNLIWTTLKSRWDLNCSLTSEKRFHNQRHKKQCTWKKYFISPSMNKSGSQDLSHASELMLEELEIFSK